MAEAAQAFCEQYRPRMYALGNPAKPVRAVIHGVHACHDGEQHLGRANVARGLVTADVLFAGLESQPICRFAARVPRDSHKATGHLALVLVLGGHERGMRPAKAERHAEALT